MEGPANADVLLNIMLELTSFYNPYISPRKPDGSVLQWAGVLITIPWLDRNIYLFKPLHSLAQRS